jgi:hypothetical protein
MAVFAYCYYYSYMSKPEVTLGDVLSMAIKLNDHDQILLVGKMANLLAGEGLIPGASMRRLVPLRYTVGCGGSVAREVDQGATVGPVDDLFGWLRPPGVRASSVVTHAWNY